MLFLFLEAQSFLLKLSWVTSLIHLHKTKSWEFTLFAFLFYLSNFSYQYPFYWFFLWGSIHMWWSGVVGVAGTQRRTQASERPQQTAHSTNKILSGRPNQHKYNGQMRANIHSAGRKEIKQTVQSFRSSEQLNQQLCVSSAVFNYRSLSNYITK